MLEAAPVEGVDGADAPSDELAMSLAETARDLQAEHAVLEDAAASIAKAAVDLLPGVAMACVTVVGRDHAVNTLGPTDCLLQSLNAVQQEHRAGPCLTALQQGSEPMVLVEDTASDDRWPAYAGAAHALGISSVLCVRLYVLDRALGALSLFSRSADAFTENVVLAATAYAAHAAVAFDAARERDNLHAAIVGRDRIGQAKGILMERHKVTEDQAFALLVEASQNTNTPMRLIVDELNQSGVGPVCPPDSAP